MTMPDAKPQPAPNAPPKWKDALLWAILAALLLHLGENYLLGRSVWQRLDKAEAALEQIQNELMPRAGVK